MRYELEWGSGHIRTTRDLTPTIRQFEIVPVDGTRPYSVGSHINVSVMIGDQQDFRSYSLVGEQAVDGAYSIAVRRQQDGRGGSLYMSSLKPGALISLTQPQNFFELSIGSPYYLLVAGGIGITPMVGMALRVAATDANFRMLYAVHSREELAFADLLQERLGNRLKIRIAAEGTRIDLDSELRSLPPDAEVYLCGPLRMLDAARHIWQQLGRPASALRFETFGSSGRFARQAFDVEVRDLNRRVHVAEDQSMLEALRDAGVAVISDCVRGECGLCMVDVISVDGELDHRDVFLSEEQRREQKQMCACVSRVAGSSVVIDTGYRPASR